MNKSTIAILAALTFVGAASVGAAAQAPPADRPQDQQILEELRQIRQLLERAIAPQPRQQQGPADDHVSLAVVSGYVLGRPDAPLTMIEFSDLQCPFCRQFHATTFAQLKKDYIDSGQLRYISRDFPLDQLHPLAVGAARAARCASEQGKYWEMRHAILAHDAQLTDQTIATLAETLQLDSARFKACAGDTARFSAEIEKDRSEGAAIGVGGTPTFVIGRTTASGLDGVRVVGAQPYAAFDAKLKALLPPQPSTPEER